MAEKLSVEEAAALHLDQIDVLVETDKAPFPIVDPPPGDAERAIAEHASAYVDDGDTLQTGIGAIPRRSPASSPRATAATTDSTRRCSPPG